MRRNRATDEEQRYLDMFDPVTRLPRPALVRDRLGMALARAERERRMVGVMFVHVDVPEEYDPREGGGLDVLPLIAGRLRSVVRPDDTVGRVGEHDFAIVCNSLSAQLDLDVIAERVSTVIALRVYFDDERTPMGTTIRTHLATPRDSIADLLEIVTHDEWSWNE